MNKPKLIYFDAPVSRGEECRLPLHLAGVDFDDVRIKVADWPALKEQMPYGALPVLEPMRQCLVRQVPQIESATDREKPDPPTARQYRITVRVAGPKDTRAWIQALVTKG